jgi:addiction module RelB/DinJ family antitoxin
MNAQATDEFRVRIDRALIKQAKRVAEETGTTPGEVVRLLFRQMVKRRAIPFPLHADSPESEVLGSPKRRSALWAAMNEGKPPAKLFNGRLDSSIPTSCRMCGPLSHGGSELSP